MPERIKRVIIYPLLVLGIILGSGCTQLKEVEQLAIVGALTYDKVTENGQDKYQASALIYKPIEMGGEKKGSSTSPYLVTSAMGISLADAQNNLRNYSSRYMIYSHAEIIIVGERLMREDGVEKLIDLIVRSRNIRLRTFLFVAEGEAVNILAVKPWQEPTLSQEIVKLIDRHKTESTSYVSDIKEFVQYSLSPRRTPLLGKMKIQPIPDKLLVGQEQGTEMLNLIGASAISENKLAGWLNEDEVKGFLFIVNQFKRGIITVQLPGKQQQSLSCQITKAKTSILPQIQDEELSVFLEVKVDLKVVDIEGDAPISNQVETEKLNKQIVDEIKQIIEGSILKSQKLKSDFFGFGESVHQKYPVAWKQIVNEWVEIYPNLPFNVNVEANIREPGIISSPVEVE